MVYNKNVLGGTKKIAEYQEQEEEIEIKVKNEDKIKQFGIIL